MNKTLHRIACLGASLGALVSVGANSAEIRLRLLETTDLHMNLLSYDYYQDKATDQYGLARAVTLIKAARAEIKKQERKFRKLERRREAVEDHRGPRRRCGR